jgi:dTDP-4-dehydrorhamnose reductase
MSARRRLSFYFKVFLMKVLIFGGTGMLGHKLLQRWRGKFDVRATIRAKDASRYVEAGLFESGEIISSVEIEQIDSVRNAVEKFQPAAILNCVGIIKQIPDSKNVVKSLTVNAIFPHQLTEIAKEIDARLITISTDCVFSGRKGNYAEEDAPDAADLYGKSKNLGEVTGEKNCLTIRTSIIGREAETSHSLVEWFLSNRGGGGKVKGFTRAIYSGFPTIILAEILADLLVNHPDLNGLYHVSSEPIDKFRLLQMIRDAYKADIEIEPFEEFQIDRSLDSTRFRKATGFQPENWKEMIIKMAADPTPYEQIRKKLAAASKN